MSINMKVKMRWYMETRSSEEAFRKILQMTRILGLLPLDDKCELDPKLSCSSALLIAYITGNTICMMIMYSFYFGRFNTTHKYIYYGRKSCSIATHFAIIFWFTYKREKLKNVLDNLKSIEGVLVSMNRQWTWSLHPTNYLGNVLLTISVFIIENLEIPDNLSRLCHLIFLYCDLLLEAIFINQFGAFYDLMEYCLKELSATKNYVIYPKIYTTIEESCEILNEIFGPLIFLMLTLYFLNQLHQLYQAFGIYNQPLSSTFILAACIVYYSVLIMQITSIANSISSQTKKFNSTIYNELKLNENKNLLNNNELIFHFERFKEFEFAANGFFSVNKSLLCSMILAWTTYLVILLQYSSSSYKTFDRNV